MEDLDRKQYFHINSFKILGYNSRKRKPTNYSTTVREQTDAIFIEKSGYETAAIFYFGTYSNHA